MHNSVWRSFKTVRDIVSVSADFYIALAAGVLLLPLKWLCAWFFSSFIHELCHYIALKCRGITVTGIYASLKGVYMQTNELSKTDEAICAYAGPLGALLLLLFARKMPRVAVCVVVQSLYNLLPVFPLDGGRGLGCILQKALGNEWGTRVFAVVETLVLWTLIVLALYSYFRLGLGLLPAFVVIFLMVKNKKINIPCKKDLKGLQ